MSRLLHPLTEDDDDPMLSAVNLVDVFLVLVVALLMAVVVQHPNDASGESVTVIRNAGRPDMEVIVREKGRELRYRGAGSAAAGGGVRAGVAYKLDNGDMVYLPEAAASAAQP